jgi:hypothetical protein
MSLVDQQHKHLQNIAQLIQYIDECGYKCTEGEFYRTEEQAAIYAREGKGIKNSRHCTRLASDLNLFSKDGLYLTTVKDWLKFCEFWESLDSGCVWGGRFSNGDGNHFETKHE